MSLLESVMLGILQGLTEFLPVSSSGHLQLGHDIFGAPQESLLFDVLLHVGTLVAVLWVYRHDLLTIIRETLAGMGRLTDGTTKARPARSGSMKNRKSSAGSPCRLAFWGVTPSPLHSCVL